MSSAPAVPTWNYVTVQIHGRVQIIDHPLEKDTLLKRLIATADAAVAISEASDLGVQFFNLTAHDNPRDVIAVSSSSRFGELTNNPGRTLGGYMQIRW